MTCIYYIEANASSLSVRSIHLSHEACNGVISYNSIMYFSISTNCLRRVRLLSAISRDDDMNDSASLRIEYQ